MSLTTIQNFILKILKEEEEKNNLTMILQQTVDEFFDYFSTEFNVLKSIDSEPGTVPSKIIFFTDPSKEDSIWIIKYHAYSVRNFKEIFLKTLVLKTDINDEAVIANALSHYSFSEIGKNIVFNETTSINTQNDYEKIIKKIKEKIFYNFQYKNDEKITSLKLKVTPKIGYRISEILPDVKKLFVDYANANKQDSKKFSDFAEKSVVFVKGVELPKKEAFNIKDFFEKQNDFFLKSRIDLELLTN